MRESSWYKYNWILYAWNFLSPFMKLLQFYMLFTSSSETFVCNFRYSLQLQIDLSSKLRFVATEQIYFNCPFLSKFCSDCLYTSLSITLGKELSTINQNSTKCRPIHKNGKWWHEGNLYPFQMKVQLEEDKMFPKLTTLEST